MRRSRASTLPLYVGGFLGPFGGGVLAVLIPQLRDAFGATTGEIAVAVPARSSFRSALPELPSVG